MIIIIKLFILGKWGLFLGKWGWGGWEITCLWVI